VAGSERVMFLSGDYKDDNRLFLSGVLQSLQVDFAIRDVRVRYPVFQYVLEKRGEGLNGQTGNGRIERIDLPLEIFDLRFQELRLPIRFTFNGEEHEIVGMTGLPTQARSESLSVDLPWGELTDGVYLFSNCSDVPVSEEGKPVARISVVSRDGVTWSHLLRFGDETGDWLDDGKLATRAPSGGAVAGVVGTWDKRIHMVGQKSYPGAWRTGKGKIYGVYLKLDSPIVPERIVLASMAPGRGMEIHVWGVELKHADSGTETRTVFR
jgi:hypothetical protein